MTGQLQIQPGLGYLSWSRLSTYSGCGERFRLQYVNEVAREPSGPALAGQAVHRAIADAEAGRWWDDEDDFSMPFTFAEYFTAAVEDAGGPDACRWGGRKDRDGRPSEDYLWWLNYAGDLYCRRFANIRRHDEEQGLVLLDDGAEFEVAVDVEGRHLVGYLDAIMVDEAGQALIRDWKTGRSLDPFQLGVYSWFLSQSTRGITADTGQIGYLRGNEYADQLKTYDLVAWRELVPRMLGDLVRGVEAEIFPIKPSPFCVACGVRANCDYGKTLE